ncbi:MAG TPA: DUF302 domain-containing protein [Myxococcota bacterium]|nr:DUF302 domain-containing protein [Myxococcota bacterium]
MKTQIRRTLTRPFDLVLEDLPRALATEGFGVLTRIDMRETLKKKLDVDLRPYVILGACNPPLAHQAVTHDLDVGLMLPCNVIVYDNLDGTTTVAAVDPMMTLAKDDPALSPIAEAVAAKLELALAALT